MNVVNSLLTKKAINQAWRFQTIRSLSLDLQEPSHLLNWLLLRGNVALGCEVKAKQRGKDSAIRLSDSGLLLIG